MVHSACLDRLHILLEHGLEHLPSSGSAWWVLGVCVMVKRVSEMSERKVSKSKCCLPPGSSSSSPSSMGTTLQKSWLHHFSVGLQTSSSCMRRSKGAMWAPCTAGVHAWLPSCPPSSSHAPRSVYCSTASHLARWCFQKGEPSIPSAWHPIPLGLSHPGAFTHPSPKLPSAGICIAPPFSSTPPFPHGLTRFGLETSPSRVDLRSWKEKTACVTPSQGGCGAGQTGPLRGKFLGARHCHRELSSAFTLWGLG